MKVLILGGTAFIGPHVARALAGLGHEVTVFHRGRTEVDLPAGVRHLHCPDGTLGDRSFFSGFRDRFREIDPDVVLDMIPVTEDDARVAVKTFRGLAGRLVAISSQDVYRAYGVLSGTEPGELEPVPITEAASLRTNLFPYRGREPRSPDDSRRWMDDYDKILVERVYLGDDDLPGTILRLPMVHGPHDRQHRTYEYVRRMLDDRPAILIEETLARWRWTRGYVENVAAAIVLAVTDERASNRVYNVGEAEAMTTIAWIGRIAAATGWGGEIVTAGSDSLPPHLRSTMNTEQSLVTDSSRIREELGYEQPIDPEEAMRRTVEWERSHPPEPVPDLRAEYEAEDAALATLF